MEIDEALKSNLIADVENILEVTLTPNEDAMLARCFEITIGHHYASNEPVKEGNAEEIKNAIALNHGYITWDVMLNSINESGMNTIILDSIFNEFASQSHKEVTLPSDEEVKAIKFIIESPSQDYFVSLYAQQSMSFGEATDNSIELANYWSKQYDIVIKWIKSQIKG